MFLGWVVFSILPLRDFLDFPCDIIAYTKCQIRSSIMYPCILLFPGNALPATGSCLPRTTPACRSTLPRLTSPQVSMMTIIRASFNTYNFDQVAWLEDLRPMPSVEPSGGWGNPTIASTGSPKRTEWSTRSSRFDEAGSSHPLIFINFGE